MPDTIISMHLVRRGLTPTSAAARFCRAGQGAREAITRLAEELVAGGSLRDGRLVVRVDGSTGVAATQTIGMAQATSTAGDKILIRVYGAPTYVLTGVAGAAVAANGQYSIDTSDTAVAASVAAAINAVPGLKDAVGATSSSGTVTATAKEPGTIGNTITLGKAVTNGAAVTLGGATFVNGADPGDKADVTVTLGAPDITANDTIVIGSVTLTWVASAGNENQITLSTTPATAATNLLAVVNAHSKLNGLVTASADSSTVVRLTYEGDPRAGELLSISRTEVNSGSVVLSAALFGSGATEAFGAASRTFAMGAP